jgi:hypothetical protein
VIRPATAGDFDHIFEIARSAYPEFNEETSRLWGLKALQNPNILIAIGDRGFGVCGVSAPFYAPHKPKAVMLFLASTERAGYEPCAMLRYMIKWSQERGAVSFHFGEDTGVNLAPLAKRVRATKDRDTYAIKF